MGISKDQISEVADLYEFVTKGRQQYTELLIKVENKLRELHDKLWNDFYSKRGEYILCAAIYVDTGKTEPRRASAAYPKTGLVFSGQRHGDCYVTLNAWEALLSTEERHRLGEEVLAGRDDGFVTSTGRFVSREEGAKVAFAAGQIHLPSESLTSEMLY